MPRCLLPKRSFGIGKLNPDVVEVAKGPKTILNPKKPILKKKPVPKINSKNSAKIPITMRFHLNYLTKKSFTADFTRTGNYEYASDYSFNARKTKGKKYRYDDFITLPDTGEIMKNSKPAKFETKTALKNSGNSNMFQIKRAKQILFKKTESQIRSDCTNLAKNKPTLGENLINPDIFQQLIQDNNLNSFQMPCLLDRHFTGETTFVCGFNGCLKTFTDSSNLRAHQKNAHHHNWKWVCLKCSKPFSLERYLYRHNKTGCAKFSLQNSNLLSTPRDVIMPVKIVLENYAEMIDEIQKLAYTLSNAY